MPQARQNDLHIYCLTKEINLWRFQELYHNPRLRHQEKWPLKKLNIIIDLKSHPFPEEADYYKEKCQNNFLLQFRWKQDSRRKLRGKSRNN